MKLEMSAKTHVGLVRTRNEDSFGTWPRALSTEQDVSRCVLAVADGMGGHPGGEVASALAVEAAISLSQESSQSPTDLLRRIYIEAQQGIAQRGVSEPQFKEMGTTLSLVHVEGGRAHLGHIGDTRVYWIRGSRWIQVTRDHTVAQELVESGKLEAEMIDDHPMSNVLTRCLGVCPDHAPDVLARPLALEAGDRLLLATDGLVKTVHSQTVQDLVAGLDCESGADQLIEAALSGGAPDNVTVLLLRVHELDGPADDSDSIRFENEDPYPWRLD